MSVDERKKRGRKPTLPPHLIPRRPLLLARHLRRDLGRRASPQAGRHRRPIITVVAIKRLAPCSVLLIGMRGGSRQLLDDRPTENGPSFTGMSSRSYCSRSCCGRRLGVRSEIARSNQLQVNSRPTFRTPKRAEHAPGAAKKVV